MDTIHTHGSRNVFARRGQRTIPRLLALNTLLLSIPALSQTSQPTVLTVVMENVVQYQENFANQTKNGSSTAMEPTIGVPLPFSPGYFIADIVSINGIRCKGTAVAANLWFGLRSAATGSQAIADIVRNQAMDIAMEIQKEDGSSIGSIFFSGLTAGAPPAGAPKSAATGIFAIVGGTGSFMGARGQASTIQQSARFTSTMENPVNRRNFPAGVWRFVIQLIPMIAPEILMDGGSPLILHGGDSSPVSAQAPARAGEELILFATGLGPTIPGVDPGQPFMENPAQMVSAPVEVLVNDKAGEVLSSRGYPDAADRYQVRFRMPDDLGSGLASVQLRAAWVASEAVKLPVQ